MRRIISTLILLLVLLPTTASPATDKDQPYNIVGQAALERVCVDWRPIGWVIEFGPGREGYLGMTVGGDIKKVEIWIRPEHSPSQVAVTIVHELAHVFDQMYLTDIMRTEWLVARNLPLNTPWYPKYGGSSDESTGCGDFAESVSWTFQGSGNRFSSKLGPPPNDSQQELIRYWFSSLAGT